VKGVIVRTVSTRYFVRNMWEIVKEKGQFHCLLRTLNRHGGCYIRHFIELAQDRNQ
jgi:hypothetical protein